MVRQAVIASLPAAAKLKDPLPAALRNQYGLIELTDAITNIHFPQTVLFYKSPVAASS